MKSFIAYFDYLGFKEFIENNDLEFQQRIIGNNFRDIESALGQGKFKEAPHGVIADLSTSRINCINFSDTVVFWTKDETEQSLIELLNVAYKFNWQAIDLCFPVRGSVVYGELLYIGFKESNGGGGFYNVNSVFGKGLVKAHLKADGQNWAGTVIDESCINELNNRGYNIAEFLSPYAKKYRVPYKNAVKLQEEYVFNLIQGTLNDEAFKNISKGIKDNFAAYNKSVDNPDVQEKLRNTLTFLESHYAKE